MKKIMTFCLFFLAVSLFAQEDSLINEALPPLKDTIIVSLDPTSEGRLASIDDSARPYSLKELIQCSKGLNSINLNFWIAVVALVCSILTFVAQRKTEKHTKNVPIKDQREKFRDLSRHEYRNLCCALAAAIKFFDSANGEEKNRLTYPSESNLKKLKVQPEDIVLSIDSDVAALISEVRLLLRNYNIEIDVASQHLSRKNISDDSLLRDFDNLLFKPLFLVYSAYRLELALINNRNTSVFKKTLKREDLLTRTVITVVKTHFNIIERSFPRYIEEKNYKYLQLLGTVNDLSLTMIDRTSAILRSLNILIPPGTQLLFNYNQLDVHTKQSIIRIDSFLKKVKDEHPDEYNFMRHYASFIDDLKNNYFVDFRAFFPVALLLDAIVETMNIGMVNYE